MIVRTSLLAVLLGVTVSTAASAAPVIYTDRAAWAAAAGAVTTETFSDYPQFTPVTASTVFTSNIVVTPLQNDILDIHGFAFSNIGYGNALRTFANLSIALGGAPTAFGFDYADLEQPATISFGSYSFSLALTGNADTSVTPDDFAFFGVIADAGDIAGGIFTLTRNDAVSIDNLAFGTSADVPEPAMLGLFGLGALGLGLSRRRKA